ncbi:MAG: nuclear transport factor 2 family protein [Pseudomonadota bacterium]|nr:nuclear transport factor 2 family protein [Sphingomonas sp.]MDQ3478451.1 nuclear transport factor 2 family protein [Pseudomonadota bacterium]
MATDRCELIGSLEREWRDALCAKDMERLRALIHPNFALIGSRSSGPFTMGRDEWLEAIQKRELVGIDLNVKDAAVFNDVIVATVEANWCVKYRGKPVQDCVLLTDVWVCEQGQWQVVRRHSSPVPTADCIAATS